MNDKTYAEQAMDRTEKHASFANEVWEKLSRLDVSEHTDVIEATAKRPEIAYLSWSRAWTLLKRNFPASTYSHRQDLHHVDTTVEVEVDVVIACGDTPETMFTNARLAVMDMWFNPIPNPTARQINDARQRALVKALAFAGLGLNLWSDSAIPVGKLDDPIYGTQVVILDELIEKSGTDIEQFLDWCEVENLEDLPSERYTSALRLLEAKIRRMSEAAAAEKKAKK